MLTHFFSYCAFLHMHMFTQVELDSPHAPSRSIVCPLKLGCLGVVEDSVTVARTVGLWNLNKISTRVRFYHKNIWYSLTAFTLDNYTDCNKVCSRTFSHITLFFESTCSHELIFDSQQFQTDYILYQSTMAFLCLLVAF